MVLALEANASSGYQWQITIGDTEVVDTVVDQYMEVPRPEGLVGAGGVHTFELFAEIGVVLLMFSIGTEFSLQDLLREKWVALLGGPLGILLSVGLGVGVGTLLGWRLLQGVIVGIVISVASTMVLSRLLQIKMALGV